MAAAGRTHFSLLPASCFLLLTFWPLCAAWQVEMVASPRTHARFLRRHEGTYGPPIFAEQRGETIPYASTQVPGLLHCGDSTFPGIGVPSASGSGMNAANTLVSPLEQLEQLEQLRALQHGASIGVRVAEHSAVGIDTPEDYARFVARTQNSREGRAA